MKTNKIDGRAEGNSQNEDDAGMASYMWTVPDVITPQKCVLRLRYNMTTDDYPSR